MGTAVTKFVEALSDKEKIEVILSYEQFEKDGFIGDEPVRVQALRLLRELGMVNDDHITMWMHQVAFECFRFYARKYIESYTA